jgi:hypothetical protein
LGMPSYHKLPQNLSTEHNEQRTKG